MNAALSSTRHAPAAPVRGVAGWLLALCWMLMAIGPAISLALLAYRGGRYLGGAGAGGQVLLAADVGLTLGALAYGVHAGWGLLRVRPGAVATARSAMLAGIAAEILRHLLQAVWGPEALAHSHLLAHIVPQMLPGLAFFTLVVAYLNKSRTVEATYAEAGTGGAR